MGNEVFNIEFKFPTDHADQWGTIAAKARESASGTWEIYAVLSYGEAAPPFQTKLLTKELA
jgi:hypothetical protein